MEKLTDEQIIKALECCSNTEVHFCTLCPMFIENKENDFCQEDLAGKALDLINRKDAEIERLKAEIRNTDNALASLDRPLIEAKSEAYKEFAERTEKKILPLLTSATLEKKEAIHFCLDVIQNELKELTEGGNEDGMDRC